MPPKLPCEMSKLKLLMRNILIIGFGKSTLHLIWYLLDKSDTEQLQITIADNHLERAKILIKNHPNLTTIKFDIFNETTRKKLIKNTDIIA